jgi:putative transposase
VFTILGVGFRSFQVVLQPTRRQAVALGELLDAQRELYNAALEQRIGVWRYENRSVSRFEQFGELTGWDHPVVGFGVCPARGTLTRLDRAFAAFYRRCGNGETPGFPRFKGVGRFDSVEYPDQSCWRLDPHRDGVGRLNLKGVGSVRFRGAKRSLRGEPKTITVRREGSRWRVTVFCANVDTSQPLPATGRDVGIDVGVDELVATSDGDLYPNLRHLRGSLDRLAIKQRLVAGRRRGSMRRRQAAAQVARLHRKIARQRRDHLHLVSRRLVDTYDLIVYEDLRITNMVRRPAPRRNEQGGFDPNGAAAKAGLNREILAAGWGQLRRLIVYKAEDAGREVIAVNPRHTSQTCHTCGHVDGRDRHGSVFRCSRCGRVAHADVNAAANILRAGQAHRLTREATRQVA